MSEAIESTVTGGGRTTCTRCWRPATVCYCRHVTPVVTRTRVVFLQHPRERNMPIGTARMASLCLPNSELHVGVDWTGSPVLQRLLADPHRTPMLLYPGEAARDVTQDPPRGPVNLVVVDGTWWQAKKIVRDNPELAALPRLSFVPGTPSEYRIRKEPTEDCVSTIEALVVALGAIEGEPHRFFSLLAPFRAMVDMQLLCEERYQGARVRHRRKPRPVRVAPPLLPSPNADRNIVCVAGEANAWPYASSVRTQGYADELVHWVARRIRSGETFERIVAARSPLAPGTPGHVGLSADVLCAGGRLEELIEAWPAFLRDDDLVCTWGHYAPSLLVAAGGTLRGERVDLRAAARLYAHGPVGTPSEFIGRYGITAPPAGGAGRAQARLAQIVAIARYFQEHG